MVIKCRVQTDSKLTKGLSKLTKGLSKLTKGLSNLLGEFESSKRFGRYLLPTHRRPSM